jgi:hypothetical protein
MDEDSVHKTFCAPTKHCLLILPLRVRLLGTPCLECLYLCWFVAQVALDTRHCTEASGRWESFSSPTG